MDVVFAIGRMDTSVLEKAIIEIVAIGKRTIRQQCVTSAVFIAFKAQELTPAADIGVIDSELEITSVPKLSTRGARKGLPLKSGKKQIQVSDKSYAMMIAIARLHPGSRYSRLTGNRWAVAMPDTEGTEEFMDYMAKVATRMVSGRHSSTHFLQTGWTPAIRTLISDPDYVYAKGTMNRSEMAKNRNSLNTMNEANQNQLGFAVIESIGDGVRIQAENDIGLEGNDVLAKKHNRALMLYGAPALQEAIDIETGAILSKLDEQWNEAMAPIKARLLT